MRKTLAGGALTALLMAGLSVPAAADTDGIQLTLLGTSDTHGHIFNWDYFANAQYTDQADILGFTRVATYVEEVRNEVGDESVILMDSGDSLQGTPLTYYYGMGEGADEVLDGTVRHPIAETFDYIGYDTLGIGNHEFNYGLEMLGAFERDLDTANGGPALLGANVLKVGTEEPWLTPYTIVEREIDGETVKVGVLGMVTPWVSVWDKQHVEGVLEFEDLVKTAKKWVPIIQAEADVVVLNVHSGKGPVADADYDETEKYEDVINNVAYQVPGIDFILFGHTHRDEPQSYITNVAGEEVLLSQPYYWTRSITRTTINLIPDGDGWQVDWSEGEKPSSVATYGYEITEEHDGLSALMWDKHQTAIAYVNTPVAESVEEMTTATSRYEDTPILDFVNYVQEQRIIEAMGDDLGDRTVISHAAPFSRTSVFPEGQVTIRDIAGLYIYENTLLGIELTGAQVQDFLEYSARYFKQVEPGAEFDPEDVTNAHYEGESREVLDYNYDVLSGVHYLIDISQPVGSRIVNLSYPDGTPVGDNDLFVMAINNYRQSGGGGFPHVADAPVVWDGAEEIRQLLIDWALVNEVIDPADFFDESWFLVSEVPEEPGEEDPDPTETPTDPGEEDPDPTDPGGADPSPQPTTGGPTDPGDGKLSETGAPVGPLVAVTGVLLLLGAAVLLVRRKLAGS